LNLALPSPHEFVLLGEDDDGKELNGYDDRANSTTDIDRSAHQLIPPKIPGSAGILACLLRSVSYCLKRAGKDACAPRPVIASI
jgi:hypothetical protein